ncbi:MAG: AAA family ATPase [Gemmatimonas sp.]
MIAPTLPNPWNFFNLQSSPFWQDPLGDRDSTHPLSLFVGRQADLTSLISGLFSAGRGSSRRAISGNPGIGKTTLVKRFKAEAHTNGFLTTDSFVPVFADDTNEALFGRVLGAVYDILLANRPGTVEHSAMQSAQVLVRSAREKARGGGVSLFGVGGSLSQSTSVTAPKDMLLDGPRVLRDLMTLVQESDAQGVLVHIDNLENLSDAGAANAGTIMRDLRDPLFMHNGLHVVVVGTPDAVHAAVMAHQQVRTTFSVRTLDPMPLDDVHTLLAARYEYLQRDATQPLINPVEPSTTQTLYELFRGDLRGLLQALDDGVTPNIGLVPPIPSDDATNANAVSASIRPLRFDDISRTLRQEYQEQLTAVAEDHFTRRLLQWGEQDANVLQTQRTLETLWQVKQGTVSDTLAYLVRQGYVQALPREGRAPVRYVLSGRSRLIFS